MHRQFDTRFLPEKTYQLEYKTKQDKWVPLGPEYENYSGITDLVKLLNVKNKSFRVRTISRGTVSFIKT